MFYDHMKRGDELTPQEQHAVLSRYVHRFTKDHKPNWARGTYRNNLTGPEGRPYPVQFASDQDWPRNTTFRVTKAGRLHKGRSDCWSTPTWPDNPELRNGRPVGMSSEAIRAA